MKTKLLAWMDNSTKKMNYGIKVERDGSWYHIMEDGKQKVFTNIALCEAKMEELRKL